MEVGSKSQMSICAHDAFVVKGRCSRNIAGFDDDNTPRPCAVLTFMASGITATAP